MGVAGIVVPGGFGYRGIEGKVQASRYARHNRIPYLGLCLGMQCAVIDFARETLDAPDANSTEFAAFTSTPVIDLMPEQRNVDQMGGVDAARPLSVQAAAGLARPQGVRRRGRVRAPPPPLRVQQRVPRGARRGGHGVQRRVAERPAGRDHRARRPPVVRGEPVPPGVPLAAEPRRTRCSATSCGRRSCRAASTRWSFVPRSCWKRPKAPRREPWISQRGGSLHSRRVSELVARARPRHRGRRARLRAGCSARAIQIASARSPVRRCGARSRSAGLSGTVVLGPRDDPNLSHGTLLSGGERTCRLRPLPGRRREPGGAGARPTRCRSWPRSSRAASPSCPRSGTSRRSSPARRLEAAIDLDDSDRRQPAAHRLRARRAGAGPDGRDPRPAAHQDLMAEVAAAGARIRTLEEGDVAGAVMAAVPGSGIDAAIGIDGAARDPDRRVRRPLPRRRAPGSAVAAQRGRAAADRRRGRARLRRGGPGAGERRGGRDDRGHGRAAAAGGHVRQRLRGNRVAADVEPPRDHPAADHAPPRRRGFLLRFRPNLVALALAAACALGACNGEHSHRPSPSASPAPSASAVALAPSPRRRRA